jgi:predicted cupin superfamily sugar epimerase
VSDGLSESDRLSVSDGRAVASALDLAQLPLEGGLFRRTYLGQGMSAILFLLTGGEFSAMHRLAADEIYFHHAGSSLRMLLIDPTASIGR